MKRNMKKYKGTQSLCRGGERSSEFLLGPKGYIGRGRARNFSKSQSPFTEGKLGIFLSPKAYIGGGGL